ncbi:MAG: pyruvate dehydrogenase complex E1 component subunit beta [Candidatus Gorgyraea atricola]|nr:pyruvate dehydrogenase complex E1 component subunit beta [Candidatus Gorgyraea atricola]
MPWTKVYPDRTEFENARKESGKPLRGLTYREAIKEAFTQILEEDSRVFLIGEGIDDAGGVFGTTKDLHKRFGRSRIIDIPIAENATTGIAIGAAITGMRPVFIHMRMDFLPMSMDQIINHAAKWSYMFGGTVKIPLTIRSIIGRGWGSASQHSQSLQALFMHVPGLRVAMPATPYDVKGLLISSVKENTPVIFIEHRWLYEHVGYVPEDMYTVPFGKGVVRRIGRDVTLVGISYMMFESLKAQEVLQKHGVSVEVIDLRTLTPLDEDLILESVKKTGRLVVADTGWSNCGVAAEIVSRVSEKAFKYLKSPAARIGLPESHTPASSALEKEFYPDYKDIVDVISKKVKE